MSEPSRLKAKLKNHYLNGFYLDKNTFLKTDDADIRMVPCKGHGGKVEEKP